MVVRPCAPRTRPMIDMHQSRMRFDMPPTPITSPAKRKNGTARSENLSMAPKSVWWATANGTFIQNMSRHADAAIRMTKIGKPSSSSTSGKMRTNQVIGLVEGAERVGDLLLHRRRLAAENVLHVLRQPQHPRDQHAREAKQHRHMRKHHRDLGRHAALVDLPRHAGHGPRLHDHEHADGGEHDDGNDVEHHAGGRRDARRNEVHLDVPAFPGDEHRAEEHRPHHEVGKDLLGPDHRLAQNEAPGDVAEVDRDRDEDGGADDHAHSGDQDLLNALQGWHGVRVFSEAYRNYWTVIFASRITFPQRLRSWATASAISRGVLPTGSACISVRSFSKSGSRTARAMPAESFAAISIGVPGGAT